MAKMPAMKVRAKKPVGGRMPKPAAATPKMLKDVARKLGVEPREATANVAVVAGRAGLTRKDLISYLWQAIRNKRKLPKGWDKRKKQV